MMTKHGIEIEGLPPGWKAVAYRKPLSENERTLSDDERVESTEGINFPCLIVERIKPREITVVETGEDNTRDVYNTYYAQHLGIVSVLNQPKIWKLKEGKL